MVIHKIDGIDTGITIFISVLCGSPIMNRKKATMENDKVTCKKCLKILNSDGAKYESCFGHHDKDSQECIDCGSAVECYESNIGGNSLTSQH